MLFATHLRIRMLALVTILGVLTGCASAPNANVAQPTSAASTPAAEPTHIRLGYQPTVVFAPIYVGIERGYFAEEGIQVDLSPIQATNEAVVQLAAGNFDIAVAGGNAGVFNALQRGLKFSIVAPVHNEQPPLATPLVISAKRTGEFKSVADLKGKTVGIVANGAAIEYWVAQALEQAGLTINDVQLKAMPFPNMPAALENGSLDAAVLTEPLVTINKDKGVVAVLKDDFINGFTATYLFMNQDWLKVNDAVARRFLRGYLRGVRDLQGSVTPEIATIVEKYTQVPAAVVQRAAFAHYRPDGRVPVEDLQTLQTFFLARGELSYSEPLDLTPFIDTQLAPTVASELDSQGK